MSQDISPYNTNKELVAMKQDIADRNYNLMIKEALIIGASVIGLAALGAVAGPVVLAGGALAAEGMVFGALGGAALGMVGGGAIAGIATYKERTKLKIDEEMVQSYMQGKNHWGEGYREEVAEKGYGFGREPDDRAPSTPSFASREDARRDQGRGGAFIG